jgi:cytochrome c peroxidase
MKAAVVAASLLGLGAAAAPALRAGFTAAEVRRILQHSPLLAPPADTSNARSDDPAAARLGQFLFFDPRLSGNGHLSCASCHDPEKAFTDGRAVSEGVRRGRRNTPALWNVAYNRWFFWDGRADSLWSQALKPMESPDEMANTRDGVYRLVRDDAAIRSAFEGVFGEFPVAGDRAAVNRVFASVGKALAAYQRRIVSRGAPFDVFAEGLREDDPACIARLSESARRGLAIFVGRGQCRTCHVGPNFTDGEFHDIGVPPAAGLEKDAGRAEGVTRLRSDEFQAGGAFSDDRQGDAARNMAFLDTGAPSAGRIKTPSLRNVALTAPYMHQGQLATLRDVLRYYSTLEGRTPPGPHDEKILVPLHLDEQETTDLVAFLESLTGAPLPPELLRRPASPK